MILLKKKKSDGTYFDFDKILRSGYNIDEQENEIATKKMANGKRKYSRNQETGAYLQDDFVTMVYQKLLERNKTLRK